MVAIDVASLIAMAGHTSYLAIVVLAAIFRVWLPLANGNRTALAALTYLCRCRPANNLQSA